MTANLIELQQATDSVGHRKVRGTTAPSFSWSKLIAKKNVFASLLLFLALK